MEDNKFWNKTEILTEGKRFNIVVGARSVGKSYHMKKTVLENFFKHGKQFVWVRRTKEQAQKTGMTFLGDMNEVIKEIIPEKGILFASGKRLMYKNGRSSVPVGYFIPLSTQQNFKSVDFTDVDALIFDEFLVFGAYLPNEILLFSELLLTIERIKPDFQVW